MKFSLLVATALLFSSHCYGQRQKTFIDSVDLRISSIKEEVIKIKDNYYVIQPEGLAGNIGLYIGENQVILVDNQWAKLAPRIKDIVKNITNNPIKYIINTHFHFDHTDGNKAFGEENVSIIAHKNLRKRLSNNQAISGSSFGRIVQRAYPQAGLPTITFNDSIQLYDDKEIIRIIHFPNAHTDGDAIVHFKKADIYHTGDIFVTYGLPVIDENNGGDIYSMIKCLDFLLSVSNKETRFIPGHGPISTIKELAAYRNLLFSVKEQVTNLMQKGLPLERILIEVKIPEEVGGVDKKQFISHVYRMTLKNENMRNN